MSGTAFIYYERFTAWLKEIFGLEIEVQEKILLSLFAILALYALKILIKRIVWNKTESPVSRYHWNKGIGYTYFAILILIMLRIWLRTSWSMVNILALTSAALTLALQDVVKSFAAWLYIMWRKPFQVGDRIQIGTITGDVIDISMMKFSLNEIGNWVKADQSTGRVMHVPNSQILNSTIINFSEGFPYIWAELPVLVTFESNWRQAKIILTEISRRHSEKFSRDAEAKIKEATKKYMIFYHKLTPIVYTSVQDCGVLLTLRFLVEPRSRRGCEEAIWEDILAEFEKCKDIDFAYPTQRFFNNVTEGKPQ